MAGWVLCALYFVVSPPIPAGEGERPMSVEQVTNNEVQKRIKSLIWSGLTYPGGLNANGILHHHVQ